MNIVSTSPVLKNIFCTGDKSKIKNNSLVNVNIQNSTPVNHNISFGDTFQRVDNKAQNTPADTRKTIRIKSTALGINLLKEYKKDKNTDFKQKIQEFLTQKGYNNIKVENMPDNITSVDCLFAPKHLLKNQGGTIYVAKVKNSDDEKEVLKHVQQISHEFCYAIQNELNPFCQNYSALPGEDKNRINHVASFIYKLKRPLAKHFQDVILDYINKNYTEYKISKDDWQTSSEELEKYGTMFPNKMISLTEADIYKPYNGQENFNKFVSSTLTKIIKRFDDDASIDEQYKNNPKTYRDLLKYLIYELQCEADAYKVNSVLNKYDKNLQTSKTLNDLIPLTYDAVAQELNTLPDIVDKACELKNADAKGLKSLIPNLVLYPAGKEFVSWAIDSLPTTDEPNDLSEEINENVTLEELSDVICGMTEEEVKLAQDACWLDNLDIPKTKQSNNWAKNIKETINRIKNSTEQ